MENDRHFKQNYSKKKTIALNQRKKVDVKNAHEEKERHTKRQVDLDIKRKIQFCFHFI